MPHQVMECRRSTQFVGGFLASQSRELAKELGMIQIRCISEGDPSDFEVVVRDGESETRHHVTMSKATCERLTGGKHGPDQCLDAAFRFLLDREPKESILRRFDVMVISHHFPDFERELPRYLSLGERDSVLHG